MSPAKDLKDGTDGRMEGRFNANNSETQDKTISCIDCGATFIFSVGEQHYFASKGLSEPKRCPQCRKRRRDTLVPDNSSGGVS